VHLLAFNGLRIAEALNADVDDLIHDRGHRALRITRKGGKVGRVAIAPVTSRNLDNYIADRTNGPIFLNRDGTDRLSYTSAYEQLRRLAAAAGVPGADAIHPHSFRHTFATEALDAGAGLQDVQDALGHADPRTTRRYDRSRNRLDKDPTYALAAAMGRQ
jgi:integrase